MYFFRRGGEYGGYDLYQATRATTSDDFDTPVNMGAAVNSSDFDYAPTVTTDGLTMYFVSERPGSQGPSSIWVSTRASTGDLFGSPTLVPNIGSSAMDAAPGISADGNRLYFQSTRPGGSDFWDIWMASAVADPSNASFSTGADLNVLDIDFGVVGVGDAVAPMGFDVANFATAGMPASLQFQSISSVGATGSLTTDFSLAAPIQSGDFESFESFLDTSTAGNFAASYDLNFTDVFGTDQTITLNLSGFVMPANDPNVPDLVYNAATGEVIVDPDASAIIAYSVKNDTNSFTPGNHTHVLTGVVISLDSEISEAALAALTTPASIGNVFPVGLDLPGLASLLSDNYVSRGLGDPLVPFDLVVIGNVPAVPEPSTYAMAALGLVGLGVYGIRRRRR